MKFYLIYSETRGWLYGNGAYKQFTTDLTKAKKFNRRSDAQNSINTSECTNLSDCVVKQIEVTEYQIND